MIEHLENILTAARKAAFQIEDKQLKLEALLAIAIASNKPDDLITINGIIGEMEKGALRSEAIAVIAKKLANANRIMLARELVFAISPTDNYWRAEVCARIGLYSRDALDFGNAKRFAQKINDRRRMAEVLAEINIYENHPERVRKEDEEAEQKELLSLVTALAKIGEFKKAHDLASGITLAHWRAKAFASVASILAEAL
jgi:hypothetical protein